MKLGVMVYVFLFAGVFAGGALPVYAETTSPYAAEYVAETHQDSNWIHNLTQDADPLGLYNYGHRDSKVAVSGQYVHVAWLASGATTPNNVLFYMHSTDGGRTFEEAQQIAVDATFTGEFKNLVADGPYVHIFYTGGWPAQLMYVRSSDNGVTFAAPVEFMSGYNSYTGIYATAKDGNVNIAWSSNNDNMPYPKGIYCAYSSDGGANFNTATVSYCDSGSPSCDYRYNVVDIARSGNYVYLLTTAQDINWMSTEVHLRLHASSNGGQTFKPFKEVAVKAVNDQYQASTIQNQDYSPNLAAYGKEVNIVWLNNDNPGSFDGWNAFSLRTRRSTDAGTTLEDPITLHTFTGGYSQGGYPGQETIARSGSKVYILTVKGDAPAGTFLWRSTDAGATWGTEQQISTGGWWPQIQLDTPKVHITNSSYFLSEDSGVTFNGGVNPHFDYGLWWYPSMALGGDGAIHYIGTLASAGTGHATDWILYRRLAPEPAPKAINKALHLATVDSYRMDNMQVPPSTDINFSSAMTVEFWVKLISGESYAFEKLIKKSRLSGEGSYVVGTWGNTYQIYSRLVTDQTDSFWGAWLGTGIPLQVGAWTHIAMTYDANAGTDNWRIYVNGVLSGKTTLTGNIVTDLMDSPLVVGKITNSVYPGAVDIDELRLWRRALTQNEIKQYMSGVTGTESGLRAYFNFNSTAKDMTGHGNDGVLMYKETYVNGQSAPVAPSNLLAKATSEKQIILTWTDKSTNEAGFEIERATGSCSSATTWTTISRIGADTTTYTSTGLTANTTYAYRVNSYNSSDSANSNCASATTGVSGSPNSPSNLSAVSTSSSNVNLVWKDNSAGETGFKVYRRKGTGAWTLLKTTPADAISYADAGATGNDATNEYSYQVKGCVGSVCSPSTNPAMVPFKPGGLSTNGISVEFVKLVWTDGSADETGFQIYRKGDTCAAGGTWKLIGTTDVNAVSYKDTTVSAGSPYSYRLRAYTQSAGQPFAKGYSGYTNCLSVTTKPISCGDGICNTGEDVSCPTDCAP